MAGNDIGYYTLPVILSMEGIDKQVDTKLGKAFGDVGKKAGKDLGVGLGAGLKSTESDVRRAADAYGKLKDKAADALGKVRTEEAALKRLRDTGASDDRIVRAEERLATARRNSARLTREAGAAHTTLITAQRDLNRSNDDTGRSFGRMGDLAGSAGKAITAAGVVAAGAAVVGIAALGAGLVLAGTQLYQLGADFDDVFDNIRLKTGATGDELEALQKQTTRLAPTLAVSIGDIGDVVGDVNRHLHLTGVEADNVIRAIADAGRLTGEAIDVKDLGKVFRVFNVEGKDQVAVLDQLWGASQSTGIGMNELVDIVLKGKDELVGLNLTIGESVGFLSMFEDVGLESEKAMGGLTKAAAYLAKEGLTVQDGLAGVFGEIKNLSEAESLELANKVFGAKQGGDFARVIRNGELDLQALNSAVAGTGDTIAAAARDTDDWSEKWQKFQNTIKVGLEPVGTAVFDTVNAKLGELSDWVTDHQDEVVRFFGHAGDAAIAGLSGILTFSSESLRALAEFIRGFDQTMGPFFDSMESIGNVLRWVPGFQDIGRAMHDIGKGGGALNDVLDKVPGFLDDAAGKLDDVNSKLPGVKAWWDSIVDRTADAVQFTQALGDKVTAVVNQDGTITLSAEDADVMAKLEAIGIEIRNLDGAITVTANTTEGERILQAFRDQETGKPLQPPVRPNLDQADADMQAFFDRWQTQLITPAPLPPGRAPTSDNPFAGPYPTRARGGIYDVWDSVASFANGKLPSTAMIQPPVAGGGLVQWAEPSTGGEAFIPLSGGDRSRRIWAETGRRLGVLSFEMGGFRNAIDQGIAAAAAISGAPYSYGSIGPAAFDCSGAQSYVYAAFTGKSTGTRHFTTESDFEALGFRRGYMPGAYNIGVSRGGGGRLSHMGATLPNGVNFEAGGANNAVAYGDGARGATDFPLQWYLPLAGGDPMSGGGAGGYYTGGAGAGGYGGAAGGGTPGYGPNGEAGTYSAPDAKDVREADQRVADADARVREAEAKQRELEADAKESQKIAAQHDVEQARREAQDARAEAAEVRRGKFTPGQAGGKGGGQTDPLKELVSILGGGILETFGLDGSWLPDVTSLMPVQMADSLLSSLVPGLTQQAGLGGDVGVVPGGSTSFTPFGMPDVTAPPIQPGAAPAWGGDLAAAGSTVTNDMRTIFQGNVGMDPDSLRKSITRGQDRALARLGAIPQRP